MNFQDAVKSGYTNYATFSGRSTRSAFWWWWFGFNIASIAISIVILGLYEAMTGGGGDVTVIFVLNWLWQLSSLLPATALSVRRLHDTNKSGWWLTLVLVPPVVWSLMNVWLESQGGRVNTHGSVEWFILLLVPLLAWFILIVWFCGKGTTGANQYGPEAV